MLPVIMLPPPSVRRNYPEKLRNGSVSHGEIWVSLAWERKIFCNKKKLIIPDLVRKIYSLNREMRKNYLINSFKGF